MKSISCLHCDGEGTFNEERCHECRGNGVISTAREARWLQSYWQRRADAGKCSQQVANRHIEHYQPLLDTEKSAENGFDQSAVPVVVQEMDEFTNGKHRRNGDLIERWSRMLKGEE